MEFIEAKRQASSLSHKIHSCRPLPLITWQVSHGHWLFYI